MHLMLQNTLKDVPYMSSIGRFIRAISDINQEALFDIAECQQLIKRNDWLHENQIQYKFSRKGNVWTTLELPGK